MIKNPLHLRLERFVPWQQITFMAALCERMYPNFAVYCEEDEALSAHPYRVVLDAVWELLTVKSAKINWERQLERLEEVIPTPTEDSPYLAYPALDACVALSTLLHGLLDRDELFESMIRISALSVQTVAQLETAQTGVEITEENAKACEAVCQEWDVQWAIFRPLIEAEERDIDLIRDLRHELREDGYSNIGLHI
ncbi:hypothetical protein VST7929_00202 [Vibrio stylophorae]|uniref:DUF416 family protein n=1 Tax=Vibrio stylophorae TaxID=659351 RepID=A0ABM8ZPZ0_9VIBR|nr:DUF416 family protein [Vibrio stylophorae]CAH0532373.1 hypothetical protein VST7929_00202 [Vibrio stylophorae]